MSPFNKCVRTEFLRVIILVAGVRRRVCMWMLVVSAKKVLAIIASSIWCRLHWSSRLCFNFELVNGERKKNFYPTEKHWLEHAILPVRLLFHNIFIPRSKLLVAGSLGMRIIRVCASVCCILYVSINCTMHLLFCIWRTVFCSCALVTFQRQTPFEKVIRSPLFGYYFWRKEWLFLPFALYFDFHIICYHAFFVVLGFFSMLPLFYSLAELHLPFLLWYFSNFFFRNKALYKLKSRLGIPHSPISNLAFSASEPPKFSVFVTWIRWGCLTIVRISSIHTNWIRCGVFKPIWMVYFFHTNELFDIFRSIFFDKISTRFFFALSAKTNYTHNAQTPAIIKLSQLNKTTVNPGLKRSRKCSACKTHNDWARR